MSVAQSIGSAKVLQRQCFRSFRPGVLLAVIAVLIVTSLAVTSVHAQTVSAQSFQVSSADVEVLGLFQGAALLRIDGEQKLIKRGSSYREVKVIESDPHRVMLEINGQRQEMKMSQRIGTRYAQPTHSEILIPPNDYLQYITSARINGRSARVLVDTGANIVALNSNIATAMGIDFRKGQRGQVTTASGVAEAYRIVLESVDVGGIRVNMVEASVVVGGFPETILLGMSFLRHVEVSNRDGLLVLTRKY